MDTHWKPSAQREALVARASLLRLIREFFEARQVLEVETPLLCTNTVTDPYMSVFEVEGSGFLQTSPEYMMKRLLADGVGDIYQLCKAFRAGDEGHRHNPEFSMLEWYRVDFDHHQLMDEVDEFLQKTLSVGVCERISYEQLFEKHFSSNPHDISLDEVRCLVGERIDVNQGVIDLTKSECFDLLMSYCIEPSLGKDFPCFVYHYPLSQSALSKIIFDECGQKVAARFEVYFKGVELANGYYELLDPEEHLRRFTDDNALRSDKGFPERSVDQAFLAALGNGMPSCSGVALGIDRLLMLKGGGEHIGECVAFLLNNS